MSMVIPLQTMYDSERQYACSGDRYKTTYSPQYDEDANLTLKAVGKEDLYDYIQSHKDSVDIHVLIKRYENGELGVLEQRVASYGDFTEVPKTMAEVLDYVNRGRLIWDSLPVETREKFGHSFGAFVSEIGSDGFEEKLAVKVEPVVPAEPVKEVEAE